MNQTVYQFINGYFDFEYEDQPDNIEEYNSMIDFMWRVAKDKGITEEVKQALIEIINSGDDPAVILNSYFLPGKHDFHTMMKMALDRMPVSV